MKRNIRRRTKKKRANTDAGYVHIVASLDGSPMSALDDDCPICRMLRESGEPVFTLDALGNLSPFAN